MITAPAALRLSCSLLSAPLPHLPPAILGRYGRWRHEKKKKKGKLRSLGLTGKSRCILFDRHLYLSDFSKKHLFHQCRGRVYVNLRSCPFYGKFYKKSILLLTSDRELRKKLIFAKYKPLNPQLFFWPVFFFFFLLLPDPPPKKNHCRLGKP